MRENQSSNRLIWGVCFLLAAGTFLAYWPILQNGFINYDDQVYITQNPHVQQDSVSGIVVWAFTSTSECYWHPLTLLAHALNYRLFGLNPAGHHLVSLVLHIANTLLLFVVLRRMTRTLWRSALVAALFAWHPAHVESVAWIAELKDVLSTFFELLALGAYARYAQKSDIGHQTSDVRRQASGYRPPASGCYWFALSFFALGLMCKPMIVTFPFLLLLLDYWPLRRIAAGGLRIAELEKAAQLPVLRRLLLEKVPFVLLAVLACVITFSAEHSEILHRPVAERAANILTSYARYLGLTAWPTHLALPYPKSPEWPWFRVAGVAVGLLGFSGLAIRTAGKAPYFFTGWFWFLGTLVPVIGVVQVDVHPIADRFTYVPSVGLFIMAAWGLEWLCRRWPGTRVAVLLVVGAALAGCFRGTCHQIRFWRNSETLFRHTLAVTADNPTAHACLGMALEGDPAKLAEACEHYGIAARLDTNQTDYVVLEAMALNKLGRPEEAIRVLTETANRVRDSFIEFNLAGLLAKKGLVANAEKHYRAALAIKPDFTEAHYDLALMLAACFRFDDARQELDSVLQSHPDHAGAWLSRGGIDIKQGRLEDAASDFKSALKLKPGDSYAQLNLAKILVAQGRFDEASQDFAEVVQAQPGNVEAHRDFGLALARSGRVNDAFREFSEVVRLKPDAQAYGDLAAVMDEQGNATEAVATYRKALALNPDYPPVLNNLAWLLATHPDPHLRDGAEAVRLAEQANKLTQSRQATLVGTLAAAYAEAGRFDEAVATAEKACALAEKSGDQNTLQNNRERLALYRAHQPYHTAASPDPAQRPADIPVSGNIEKLVPAGP